MMIVTIEVFGCLILAVVGIWAAASLIMLLIGALAKTYYRCLALCAPRARCSDCGAPLNVAKATGARQLCDQCFDRMLYAYKERGKNDRI